VFLIFLWCCVSCCFSNLECSYLFSCIDSWLFFIRFFCVGGHNCCCGVFFGNVHNGVGVGLECVVGVFEVVLIFLVVVVLVVVVVFLVEIFVLLLVVVVVNF